MKSTPSINAGSLAFRRQTRTTYSSKRMHKQIIATLCLVASLSVPWARAVDLIAIGTVSGTYEDFASQTAAPLESGVPGNRLGGIGSGPAFARGHTLPAPPGRGPNAPPY